MKSHTTCYPINSYTHIKYMHNYMKQPAIWNMNAVQPHAEGHSASQWVSNLLGFRLALKW